MDIISIILFIVIVMFLLVPYIFISIWWIDRKHQKNAMEVIKNGISKERKSRNGSFEEEDKGIRREEETENRKYRCESSDSELRRRRGGIFRRTFGRIRGIFRRSRDTEEYSELEQGREIRNVSTTSRITPEYRKIQSREIKPTTNIKQQYRSNDKRDERNKQSFKSAFD